MKTKLNLLQSTTVRLAVPLFLSLPLQAADQMTRFFSQLGSKVSIKGSNNLHQWGIEGQVIDGLVEFGAGFPFESGETLKLGKVPAKMEGFIPVRSLHTAYRSASIDSVVYYSINEPMHPRIHFHFSELILKTLPKSKDDP